MNTVALKIEMADGGSEAAALSRSSAFRLFPSGIGAARLHRGV